MMPERAAETKLREAKPYTWAHIEIIAHPLLSADPEVYVHMKTLMARARYVTAAIGDKEGKVPFCVIEGHPFRPTQPGGVVEAPDGRQQSLTDFEQLLVIGNYAPHMGKYVTVSSLLALPACNFAACLHLCCLLAPLLPACTFAA
jgi:hypothetical protein